MGFEEELDMHGYDYNQVLTVFYVSYVVFELPANLACKWLSPGWFLPGTTLGFGVMTVAMAFCNSMPAIYPVRFLLGLFEAGVLP